VSDHLERRWSPDQISRLLPSLYGDRPEMRVAPETIYQALYTRDRTASTGTASACSAAGASTASDVAGLANARGASSRRW
jgi:IS30 family transposase